MLLPAVFREQYETLFPHVDALTRHMEGWLTDALKELNAKVDARPKSDESVFLKMQLGKHATVLALPDLVAAKVVLLNLRDRDTAVRMVADAFPVIDATGLERGYMKRAGYCGGSELPGGADAPRHEVPPRAA